MAHVLSRAFALAGATTTEVRAFAHHPPGRLLQRVVALLAYTWLLSHCETSLGTAPLVGLSLLWLCWDAGKGRDQQADLTRRELAIELKVAEFAQLLGTVAPGPFQEDDRSAKDFAGSGASQRLADLRRRTHCLFAPRAVVWGNDWLEELCGAGAEPEESLTANVALSLPRLYRFCLEVKAGRALDAFVFEARGRCYGADLESFADTVRRVLQGFSTADPAGVDCMRKNYIHKRGWYFQFARESFFVTAFAPCYPEAHPRYQFSLHPDSCFILLQPEESFLRHDLPPDKPRSATNWEEPADIRDRIRGNFRHHGREYKIPETTSYPPAEFIVPPLDVHGEVVRFWLPQNPSAGRGAVSSRG